MTSVVLEHPYTTSASNQSSKCAPSNMPTSPTACLPLSEQPSTSTGIYHNNIYQQQVPKSEAKQYPSASKSSTASRSNFSGQTYQPSFSSSNKTQLDPGNVQDLGVCSDVRDPIRESVEQLFKFAEEEANSSSGGGNSPLKTCLRPSVLQLDSPSNPNSEPEARKSDKKSSLDLSSPSQSSEANKGQKQKPKKEGREYYTPSSQKPHPKSKSYRYAYTSRPSSTIITSHTPTDTTSAARSSSGTRPRSYTASSGSTVPKKDTNGNKEKQSSSSHSRQNSNGGGGGGYSSNGNGGSHKKKGSNSYDTASLSSCGSNQSRNSDYSFLACEGKGEFVVEKESKTLVLATTARSLTPPDDLKSNVQGYERTEGKTVVKTVKKLSIKTIQSQPPSSLTSPRNSAFLTP